MMSITADYGWFVASTQTQALSVQAVGNANLVIDGVTPQFGSLGAGLRRVGRRSGTGFGSVDFERLSSGLAFMSRGSNLDLGVSLELALGFLTFKGRGLGIFVDAYFFEPTNMTGPDTFFGVGLGYVHSPITGLRASVPNVRSVSVPRGNAASTACPDVDAYRIALARERKDAVEVCNARDVARCDAARARVKAISAALSACEQGQNIGAPREQDDAPVP